LSASSTLSVSCGSSFRRTNQPHDQPHFNQKHVHSAPFPFSLSCSFANLISRALPALVLPVVLWGRGRNRPKLYPWAWPNPSCSNRSLTLRHHSLLTTRLRLHLRTTRLRLLQFSRIWLRRHTANDLAVQFVGSAYASAPQPSRTRDRCGASPSQARASCAFKVD